MEEMKKKTESKKQSTTKQSTAKQSTTKYPRKKILKDVVLANAVRVGSTVGNYYSEDTHDISLTDYTIRIRRKTWDKEQPTVCTTLYNCIYYR